MTANLVLALIRLALIAVAALWVYQHAAMIVELWDSGDRKGAAQLAALSFFIVVCVGTM